MYGTPPGQNVLAGMGGMDITAHLIGAQICTIYAHNILCALSVGMLSYVVVTTVDWANTLTHKHSHRGNEDDVDGVHMLLV